MYGQGLATASVPSFLFAHSLFLSHILQLLPSSPASPVADRQGDAVNMDENSTLIWEPDMEIAGLAYIVNACLFKKKKKKKPVAAVVNLTRSRLV